MGDCALSADRPRRGSRIVCHRSVHLAWSVAFANRVFESAPIACSVAIVGLIPPFSLSVMFKYSQNTILIMLTLSIMKVITIDID